MEINMKKVLLSIVLTLAMCFPSLAQDLNFSTIRQTPVAAAVTKTKVNLTFSPMDYKEACVVAKRTGQVIWVVRDVENDIEVQAACEKANGLFVNADGDTDFNVGLSKLEAIGPKILYVEMPPSAFPDKPQNKQYVINRDVDRAELGGTPVRTSASGRVTVSKNSAEIDPYQPKWDAYGQRITSNQPLVRNADGSLYTGACANGTCVNGVCTTGSCATGACATGSCGGQPQQMMPMQYQQPMGGYGYPMMQGGFQGGFMGGFQGGSCASGSCGGGG